MKRVGTCLILSWFLLFAIDVNPQNTSGLPNIAIPVYLVNGISGDITLGLQTFCGSLAVDPASDSTTTIFANDTCRIRIVENGGATHTILHVEVESLTAQPLQLNEIGLQLRFARDNVDGVWSPAMPANQAQVIAAPSDVRVAGSSHPNFGVPYIATASASGLNVVSAGILRQDTSVYLFGFPAGKNDYGVRLSIPETRTGSKLTEDFYISNDTTHNWFDVAQDYADWADATNGYQPFPTNVMCYEPLYDTWYWSFDHVDAQLYADAAQAASNAGMGMFLADSGWDAPPGEFAKGLYGQTGDYTPPSDEFGNINDTFKTIRTDNQLGYVLWVQPFAVGKASKRYAATKNLHIVSPADGALGIDSSENVNLDPRTSGTQDYLKALFTELATNYKPNGFWIDFLDNIPNMCIANHPHNYSTFANGLRAALDAIRATILQSVAQPVVFNRSTYANLNNKAYANVWQPTDSPDDFDLMRIRALQMRPFSRGVAFSSDQMFWPETADDASVAKFVMTSLMVGAPSLGGDIVHSSASVRAIVAAWIGFYRKYQSDLNNGRFQPFGSFRVPNHKIETADRTFVYVRNLDADTFSAQGTKEIFILNASDFDNLQLKLRPPLPTAYSAKILDRYLNVQDQTGPLQPAADGVLNLNLLVEQGGAAVLTPSP